MTPTRQPAEPKCKCCGKPMENSRHFRYGNDIDNPVKHEFEPMTDRQEERRRTKFQRAECSSGSRSTQRFQTLCPLERHLTGSRARLEHPVENREVEGSNPSIRSKFKCEARALTAQKEQR